MGSMSADDETVDGRLGWSGTDTGGGARIIRDGNGK